MKLEGFVLPRMLLAAIAGSRFERANPAVILKAHCNRFAKRNCRLGVKARREPPREFFFHAQ